MAKHSKIEWTDHTFNPWIGCTNVSPACDHCYAEAQDKFRKWTPEGWGPHGPRRRTSEANWRKPLAWDRAAEKDGVRRKVFCASLADVFDNHGSITSGWHGDLWHLIDRCRNLDWLLLTKRPQNFAKTMPESYGAPAWGEGWPHVWIGTTVENQAEADRRIPHLLSIPARVRFLSCEPLLGPVDLRRWLATAHVTCKACGAGFWLHDADPCNHRVFGDWTLACPSCGNCRCDQGTAKKPFPSVPGDWIKKEVGRFDRIHPTIPVKSGLDWIIAGGESGPGARPSNPQWFRDLRDQCTAADVPFHFKQWGEWHPGDGMGDDIDGSAFGCFDDAGRWVHPVQQDFAATRQTMFRLGKSRAGRTLDGVTHDGMPGEAQ